MITVLVFRFSAMGDVAIASSVMKEIAAQNSEIQFVFITRALFAPFFNNTSNVEVFSVDFIKRHKGLLGLFRLYKELKRKYSIDYIADLHSVIRSKILTLLFRLSITQTRIATINKGRKEKRALCNVKKPKSQLKTIWLRYTEVFQQLKLKAEIQPVPIPYLPGKVKRIGISPFAKHKGKVYPPELLEKVLELLHKNYVIYLFGGGKKEKERCENWQAKYANVFSLVGKKTLTEELEFISTLDVMFSMDSAGMHLASLSKIPCVSIWGATHPFAGFYGFNQNESNIVQIDLPCRPCSIFGNKPCYRGDYVCLKSITPEMIAEKIKIFLYNTHQQ
jgi:ADP-heptose:LPS heptosyltransferase